MFTKLIIVCLCFTNRIIQSKHTEMFINSDADVKHKQTLFSHVILTNDTVNSLGYMLLRTESDNGVSLHPGRSRPGQDKHAGRRIMNGTGLIIIVLRRHCT